MTRKSLRAEELVAILGQEKADALIGLAEKLKVKAARAPKPIRLSVEDIADARLGAEVGAATKGLAKALRYWVMNWPDDRNAFLAMLDAEETRILEKVQADHETAQATA